MFIQNQGAARNLAKRWDKTGIIVDNQEHDKYLVKVEGKWRVTHRNRRFLRSFKPDMQTSMLPGTRPDICLSRPPASAPPVTSIHGARQVKNYDKEQYDHARGDDYDAPVTVYDNITVREGVHDAPAVLNYIA